MVCYADRPKEVSGMPAGSGRSPRSAVPRVQIAYDTETDGRRQRKELPFVLGVIGDFSSQPEQPFPKLRERSFRNVDRTTFDGVLEAMRPRLAFRVDNKLSPDDSKLAVELRFQSLDDFGPEEVALQVSPLRELIELRKELTGLLRLIHERRSGLG
jgi:type VI secretion system protein ImpB